MIYLIAELIIMEHKITLLNQQQSFMAQDYETILEAAIRAGVSLNYGCCNGACGLCKAQVIDGDVKEIKTHEYAIPEAEKLQNYILACACAANNDVIIDASVATSAADIPLQKINVKVRKVEQLSSQVFKLLVQTPRTKRFRFLAGQYIELTISGIGTSCFSIASCPCEDRVIEIHLRVSAQDPVSQQIADKIRLGNNLELQGPFGNFVYDENASRPVVLFAFDTGFAAIKSLLEHITAQEKELPIHLIWMSCNGDGLYMHNLCRSWEDAFDEFSYDGIALDLSSKQMMNNPEESCQCVEAHLVQAMQNHDDLSCHDIYVCAPAPIMKVCERVCINKHMLKTRFFVEPVRGNEDMSCIVN